MLRLLFQTLVLAACVIGPSSFIAAKSNKYAKLITYENNQIGTDLALSWKRDGGWQYTFKLDDERMRFLDPPITVLDVIRVIEMKMKKKHGVSVTAPDSSTVVIKYSGSEAKILHRLSKARIRGRRKNSSPDLGVLSTLCLADSDCTVRAPCCKPCTAQDVENYWRPVLKNHNYNLISPCRPDRCFRTKNCITDQIPPKEQACCVENRCSTNCR